MANHILNKMISNLPSVLKPGSNQTILALLTALSNSDEFLETQVKNAKEQLFVATADGVGLDRLGNSLNVTRPPTLGLIDDDFRQLISFLSLQPKQVKNAFQNIGELFFGPLSVKANTTTINASTFNLNIGDELLIRVDNGPTQSLKIKAEDVVAPGLMTAQEVVTWVERLNGVTASIQVDPTTGDERINLRTDTSGSVGSLEILTSSAIAAGKLELILGPHSILDQGQRFVVYNINPNELLIEIPAQTPLLRRTLLGSHHFHADATLEPPIAPENGIWAGSFLHDPSGSQGGFEITSQSAVLQSNIVAGDTLTTINVDDTSPFENPSGSLIFNFGRTEQEFPVKYLNIINANTIAIDPTFLFQQNHLIGRQVNVISQEAPITPRINGQDLSIYLPSPVQARIIVEEILERLKAAGIILRFEVIGPRYKYRCDSPYLENGGFPT